MSLQLLATRARQNHSFAMTGDPLWDKVLWLLHCDGPNGSKTVTDAKGLLTWAASPANAAVDNSITLIADGAFKLDGINPDNTVSYLAVPKAGWEFADNDFCMDIAVRLIAMPTSGRIGTLFSNGDEAGPSYYGVRWFINPDGSVGAYFSTSGTAVNLTLTSAAGVVSADVRSRLRLSRSGTSFKMFAEGAEIASGTLSGSLYKPTKSTNAYIGLAVDRSNTPKEQGVLSARVDECRMTLGVGAAREHAAYSPSNVPFPNHL